MTPTQAQPAVSTRLMVLLGCLATRFPKTDLKWNTKALKFTNNDKANAFVKKQYRKGFEAEGL